MGLKTQTIKVNNPILRHRERTVDNVKRLYAFILSLSFTNTLREIFDTAHGALKDPTKLPGLGGMLGLDFALFGVFLFTAAIYYFHSDKFLDIRYALPIPGAPVNDPEKEVVVIDWRPGQFGWDYLTLLMTLIPFAVMSFTLDPELVERFGFMPFYATYVVLVQFSVGVIVVGAIWRLIGDIRRCMSGEADEQPTYEDLRYSALNVHWVLIDSVAILVLQLFFWIDQTGAALCGPLKPGAGAYFVVLFLIVATLRNLSDYVSVWPFLYLSGDGTGAIRRSWSMRILVRANLETRGLAKPFVAILYLISLWVTWTQLCRPLFDLANYCHP